MEISGFVKWKWLRFFYPHPDSELEASLAPAEGEVGAVAKADQKVFIETLSKA